MTMMLNGLWQGVLLVALMWGLLKLVPGVNAATHHALWWITLAAVVMLPLRGLVAESAPAAAGRGSLAEKNDVQASGSAGGFGGVAMPETDAAGLTGKAGNVDGQAVTPRGNAGGDRGTWFPVAVAARPVEVVIGGVWVLASAGLLIRLVRGYGELKRIKRSATKAPARWQARLRDLRAKAGIGREAALLVSEDVGAPLVVGLVRPAIVIPRPLMEGMSEADFDHVALHELAHLGRYDDWTNLVEKVIEALLPIQPAVFWIGGRMALEREAACDDWVVGVTGTPKPYAASLTRVAELTLWARGGVLASGAIGHPSQLYRRVQRLLDRRRNGTPRVSAMRAVVGLVAVIGMLVMAMHAPQMIAVATAAPAEVEATTRPVAVGGSGALEKWESPTEFTQTQTFAVAAGEKLAVDVDQGNVHVSTWDQKTVKIVVRHRGRDVAEFLKHHTTTMSKAGKEVRLKAEGDGWADLGKLRVEIDYEIQQPATMDAQVDNKLGNIEVAGLQGMTNAETAMGNVDVKKTTGKVQAETGSGNVTATDCGGTLALGSKQGNVSVWRFAGDSVQAETAMGNVSGDLTVQPKGDCALQTKMGNVDLKLVKTAGVVLTMSSNMGNVQSDLGKGAINGGGPVVRLETSMGNVHVTGK